ncbi:spermidine hydroxycinnamoyl transferase-like [Humulus lupulus]|uniref:spermidine hydroxycinnamoyl transferase-like n=1 Tax=Humulus lupulus TaxID=3486 RepID=UPI002B409015|nr:spermidine hydroxycinnamoyl transferase-like [Humulus lupulus]
MTPKDIHVDDVVITINCYSQCMLLVPSLCSQYIDTPNFTSSRKAQLISLCPSLSHVSLPSSRDVPNMMLSIKRNLMVTPAESTWTGIQSLSEWDQIGCTTNARAIYFYGPTPTPTPFQTITETLIDSLSQVLVHFYPLAGRLRSFDNGRFELLCNGHGATFVAAELNADLVDFGADNYFTPTPDFDRFLFPYINETLPIHELPLLLLQLTKFRCGGLCLSFTSSHITTDGLSAANFMTEWARLAQGLPLRNAPVLDKKAFRVGEPGATPRFDHSKDFCNMPFLLKQPTPEELEKMKTTMVTLKLTNEQVEKLKKMSNQDSQINAKTSRPYTRYEALTAYIWRCSSKARKHQHEQPTACLITIDSRKRIQPPLPFWFFGNGVFDITASCNAGELLSKPLSHGASKVRSAIEMVTSDYVLSAIDFLKCQENLTEFQYSYKSSTNGGANYGGNPNIGVINWMNLPFEGIDFGWGKEIHFGPANHEVDGDTWLLRGGDEAKSLLIVVCLLVEHVEAFKKHFYDDINCSPAETLYSFSDGLDKELMLG